MKIKKKNKKKSGSKNEILRNPKAQPKRLVSYKKKECIAYSTEGGSTSLRLGWTGFTVNQKDI